MDDDNHMPMEITDDEAALLRPMFERARVDERAQAWEMVCKHPLFADCYDKPLPLMISMKRKLDELYENEEQTTEHLVELAEMPLAEMRELAYLRTRTFLSVEQIKRLRELLTKYWAKAPATENEEKPDPSKVFSHVEIKTIGKSAERYLIDLSEVSTKMAPIVALEYLLGHAKFIKVADSAGTEKLIAVETIEEARVL